MGVMKGAYPYLGGQSLSDAERMLEQQRVEAAAAQKRQQQLWDEWRAQQEPIDGGELKAEPVDVIALPAPSDK